MELVASDTIHETMSTNANNSVRAGVHLTKHATIEINTFRLKLFLNGGLFRNPESSETYIFLCVILVVYIGRGIIHQVALLFFPPKKSFWESY